MKLFTSIDFSGQWPVPTALVVRAESKERAEDLAQSALKAHGLKFDGTLVEMPPEGEFISVLSDGDY